MIEENKCFRKAICKGLDIPEEILFDKSLEETGVMYKFYVKEKRLLEESRKNLIKVCKEEFGIDIYFKEGIE